jgi:hypothetical protein
MHQQTETSQDRIEAVKEDASLSIKKKIVVDMEILYEQTVNDNNVIAAALKIPLLLPSLLEGVNNGVSTWHFTLHIENQFFCV